MNLRFRKLFTRRFEGQIDDAIVWWTKTPYEQRTYPVFPHIDGSPMKTYYSKYRYILYIDFWLFRVSFDWIGKDRRPPNATS